jgi:hypothetical protein
LKRKIKATNFEMMSKNYKIPYYQFFKNNLFRLPDMKNTELRIQWLFIKGNILRKEKISIH